MTVEKGFQFLETQLQRSDMESQAQLRRIIKNPRLLFIFADLITIPMFEKLKLINFNKLNEWRLTVPCWLSVFMDFARDSYKYLAFPPTQEIKSILDIKEHSSSDTEYVYGILGPQFHTIIEDTYKNHLATPFFAFANPNKASIKGVEQDDWKDAFLEYRMEVISKLEEWSTKPDRPKKYRALLDVLAQRVTYILDEAHMVYPYISKLRSPLPLACETFIKDIGTSLHDNESAILEVSKYSGCYSSFQVIPTMQFGDDICNIQQSVGYFKLACILML
jgi:hypothetical protein